MHFLCIISAPGVFPHPLNLMRQLSILKSEDFAGTNVLTGMPINRIGTERDINISSKDQTIMYDVEIRGL